MSQLSRLDELLAAVCEQRISDADFTELSAMLRDSDEARCHYLRQIDLHHSLRWLRQGECEAELLLAIQSRKRAAATAAPHSLPPRRRRRLPALLAGIAAVAAVACLLVSRTQPSVSTKVAAEHGNPQPDFNRPESVIVGTITRGIDALWSQSANAGENAVAVGDFVLAEGSADIHMIGGARLFVAAPTTIRFLGPQQLELVEGVIVADAAAHLSAPVAIAAAVTAIDCSDCTVGISLLGGCANYRLLRGQATVAIDASVTGRPEQISLVRNEGLQATVGGGLLTDIIGDAAVFRSLQNHHQPASLVANGGFEYPAMQAREAVAAAGWSFLVLPQMNANGMPAKETTGMLSSAVATSPGSAMPEAPEGRQWVYLGARRFADGRYFHTSMHQDVGALLPQATYRLHAVAATPEAASEPLILTIGLYGGYPESAPHLPLAIRRIDFNGQTAPRSIDLDFTTPDANVYSGLNLFVRAEIGPLQRPGQSRILIDDVQLTVLKGVSP